MNFKPFPFWNWLFKDATRRPKRPYRRLKAQYWANVSEARKKIKADREKAAMELATYGGLPQGSAPACPDKEMVGSEACKGCVESGSCVLEARSCPAVNLPAGLMF